MTRDILQERVITEVAAHKNVLLSWCTGLGKSLAAIKVQETLNKDGTTIIIVPERLMIDNWREEYYKHGKEYLLQSTLIFCYASLEKFTFNKDSINVGLSIYDEGHHITELKSQYIKTIHSNNVLILSASMHQEAVDVIHSCIGSYYEDKVTLSQAIKWRLLPKVAIVLIPLILDNKNYTQTIIVNRGKGALKHHIECTWDTRKNHIYKRYVERTQITIRCTEAQKYEFLTTTIDYYNSPSAKARMNYETRIKALFNSRITRKRFIAELKTKYVIELLKRLEGSRTLCFCQSIEQASIVGNKSNIIHSQIKNPDVVLNKFKEGEIDTLITVNMLQEGANLPRLDNVIITQLDAKERGFIQKAGRATRNPDDPTVYLPYFKNTFDEVYVLNSLDGNITNDLIKSMKWED